MKLITALLIYFGEHPILAERMDEAAKRIKVESLKEDSFLCQETLRAIKRRKGIK